MAALVSASKDGAFLRSAFSNGFASSRCAARPAGAARRRCCEMTTWAERGYDLTITPDGPRGPCYEVQDGITSLAQLTGLPIVPVAYESELENFREKLGPVSNPAAVRALRSLRGKSRFACRRTQTTRRAKNCAGSLKPNCAPSRRIKF